MLGAGSDGLKRLGNLVVGFGMEAIMVLLFNGGIWGGLREYGFEERRERGCGLPESWRAFRGGIQMIRLDEDFEGFENFETGLWSLSLDVAIWKFGVVVFVMRQKECYTFFE